MASCKYNPGINSVNPYAVLNVTQQSQSIADNTTTLRYELLLYRPSKISSSASKAYSITIDGKTVKSGTTTIGGSGTKSIASGTYTVTHDSKGEKTITFGFSLAFDIDWNVGHIGTGKASSSMPLTTIHRASSISLNTSSISLGGSITITINRSSASFTHTLQHDFVAGSWTNFATNVTTSTTLKTDIGWSSRIPNSSSSTGRIRCITYNGSKYIGEKIVNFTASVPTTVVPTIGDISIADSNPEYSTNFGALIQNKSAASVSISATGAYGSSIISYSTTIASQTYSTNSFTTSILKNSGEITVNATVRDSRGRTANKTTTINVLPYANPTISSFTANRCNASGTLDVNGTYIKFVGNGTIASCNNKNSNSWKIEYKLTTSDTWNTILTGTGYSIDINTHKSIVGGFLTTATYDFKLTITDYFTSSVSSKNASTAFALMNFNRSGKGLAIGKMSEKDVLEVAISAEFKSLLVNGLNIEKLIISQYTEPTTQSNGSLWLQTI